jgi:hypothetical protein
VASAMSCAALMASLPSVTTVTGYEPGLMAFQPCSRGRRSRRMASVSSRSFSAWAFLASIQARMAAGPCLTAARAMTTVDRPARNEPMLPQCHIRLRMPAAKARRSDTIRDAGAGESGCIRMTESRRPQ